MTLGNKCVINRADKSDALTWRRSNNWSIYGAKQDITVCENPRKGTICRFTKDWVVNPTTPNAQRRSHHTTRNNNNNNNNNNNKCGISYIDDGNGNIVEGVRLSRRPPARSNTKHGVYCRRLFENEVQTQND